MSKFTLILFLTLLSITLLSGIPWLQSCYADECNFCESDLDHNGVVDGGDLNVLAQEFGDANCCTAFSTKAVYVSSSHPAAADDPQAGFSPSFPALSISFGISQALASGRTEVRVAAGMYAENVALLEGVHLLGGYDPIDWQRDTKAYITTIKGLNSTGHRTTVTATDIATNLTILDGFVILGEQAIGYSENSYAVWVKDCSDNLVIRNNVIWAGIGGNGSNGDIGENGENGAPGGDGIDALDLYAAYGVTYHNCNAAHHSMGGAGGIMKCDQLLTNGGDGGIRVCPAWDATQGKTEPPVIYEYGQDGFNNGGAGGSAGWDVYQQGNSCSGYISYGIINGENGQPGMAGDNGSGGEGCTDPAGSVINHHWGANAASAGLAGTAGTGGGGGGSGAGAWVHEACAASGFAYDNIGASGGGGGAGGCGAAGGIAGSGGGGSFGLFVAFSSQPSAVPLIMDNVIHTGNGGKGGDGGIGGFGGKGGAGGAGGAGAKNPSGASTDPAFPSLPGGHGANGGDGGHGGGGGGGCGGVSYGIYAYGQGPVNLNSWANQNLFHIEGAGGTGGSGGGLIGKSGSSGQNGSSGATNF